jgi:hypothetical protein
VGVPLLKTIQDLVVRFITIITIHLLLATILLLPGNYSNYDGGAV